MWIRLVVAVSLALIAACSRYEWQNELNVPGLCDTTRQATHGSVPPRVRLELDPPHGPLRGRVSDRTSRQPVSQAAVGLAGSHAHYAVQTDSAGVFVIDSMPPGWYTIQVARVGFQAVRDTIEVARGDGAPFEIGLDMAVLDGPCSGFASVRVRKPWWKFW
jgi:hypothetical protein